MDGGTAPPAPPPPPMLYPWMPPPKRNDTTLIIVVVVVVVLVVLLPLILAAILYTMVSGLLAGAPAAPIVVLGPAVPCGAECWAITLTDADPPSALSLFQVVLTLPDARRLLGPLRPGTVLSEGRIALNFTDRGSPDLLDAPDRFRLEGASLRGEYELTLVWVPDGRPLATGRWFA